MLRNSKVLTETYIPYKCITGGGIGDFVNVNNDFITILNDDILVDNKHIKIEVLWLHMSVLNTNTLAIALNISLRVDPNIMIIGNLTTGSVKIVFDLLKFLSHNDFSKNSYISTLPYNIDITKLSINDYYRIYSSSSMDIRYYYPKTNTEHIAGRFACILSDIRDASLPDDQDHNIRVAWVLHKMTHFMEIGGEGSYTNLITNGNVLLHYSNHIFAMDNYEALKKNFRSNILNIQTLPYYIN